MLIVAQLVSEYRAFCGSERFITSAFLSACYVPPPPNLNLFDYPMLCDAFRSPEIVLESLPEAGE
jgi:hypothetical protein